jgi:hypothetical protein
MKSTDIYLFIEKHRHAQIKRMDLEKQYICKHIIGICIA